MLGTATRVKLRQVGTALGLSAMLVAAPSGHLAHASHPEGQQVRWAGEDRYATAAAVSRGAFTAGPVPVAYVVTGQAYPDALTAGPAAALQDGPVLPVARDEIPDPIGAELERLAPEQIVVVGGTSAVSREVEVALQQYATGAVARVSGQDRYETAAAVALDAFDGPVPQALIATGEGFADALAGGAVGAATDSPVLLVRPDSVPAATAAALRELRPRDVAVLGGTQAISDSVLAELRQYTDGGVNRLAGNDREQTAARLAEVFWPSSGAPAPRVYLTTGQQYPDALAAGPAAGRDAGPLLLTRQDCLPDATHDQLERLREATIVVVGGQAAVSDTGLTTSCSGEAPRLVISDTTPEPGDESGTVIQGTGYAPNSSVEVLFNGERFRVAAADSDGLFATEYFPTTSECGRHVEVAANGTDPSGAPLSRRGSLTVTC